MRFIDANVFIYAILKPKVALPDAVQRKKTAAQDIFLRVNTGEPVTTTTVHLSEVANVLEDAGGIAFAGDVLSALVMKSTITVEPVTVNDYRESIILAKKCTFSIKDALAILIMERQGISEIYTFDRHFNHMNVKIVQK